MEEDKTWEKIKDISASGYDFSIVEILYQSWRIFRSQAYAFTGFSLIIFGSFFFLTLLFGQLGQLVSNFMVLPCLMIGYATFTLSILQDNAKPDSKAFFNGFQMIIPLGLIAISTNLLITAGLAPSLIVFNQAGLWEALESFQSTMDFRDLNLSFNFSQKLILFGNALFITYLITALLWAPLLTFFEKLPFYKAIEGSRRLITRKWWKVFGLFVTLLLIYSLVAILLYFLSSLLGPIFAIFRGLGMILGLLIVFPLVFISSFLVYQEAMMTKSDFATDGNHEDSEPINLNEDEFPQGN